MKLQDLKPRVVHHWSPPERDWRGPYVNLPVDEMQAMRDKRHTLKEIGAAFGVAASTVMLRLKENRRKQ